MTEQEIECAASAIREILGESDTLSRARIMYLVGFIPATDGGIHAIAKARLAENLLKPVPDPQMVRIAIGMDDREIAADFTSNITFNFTDYRIKDASLERITLEADEIVVGQICGALKKRAAAVGKKADNEMWKIMDDLRRSLEHHHRKRWANEK